MTPDNRREYDAIGALMEELERLYGKEKYGAIRKELKDAYRKAFATSGDTEYKKGKTPEFVKISDEFVNGYYKGRYTIAEGAYNYKVTIDNQENSMGNFLTHAISNYVISKADHNVDLRNYYDASVLLTLMTQAYGLKMIQDNELLTKLEQSVNEVESLKEQNKKLIDERGTIMEQLEKAKKDVEECNKVLNNLVPKGDVDNEL